MAKSNKIKRTAKTIAKDINLMLGIYHNEDKLKFYRCTKHELLKIEEQLKKVILKWKKKNLI